MVPLLRFYFHEEVRQAAVQSLPELLRSAYLAAKTGKHGATPAVVKQLLDFIWPPLMDAMSKVLLRSIVRTQLMKPVSCSICPYLFIASP